MVPFFLAALKTGNSSAARMAMIAMTTSNSIKVNAAQALDDVAGAHPAHFSSDRPELETEGAGRQLKAFVSILTGLTLNHPLTDKGTSLCPLTAYFVSNSALVKYDLDCLSSPFADLYICMYT